MSGESPPSSSPSPPLSSMVNKLPMSLSSVIPSVSFAPATVSRSATATLSTPPATSNASDSTSTPVPFLTATYDSGISHLVPSTTPLVSDSSPQSLPGSLVDATILVTSGGIPSSTSQSSVDPETSSFSAQTSAAIGPFGIESQTPKSVTTSVSSVLLSTSIQPSAASTAYAQLGTISSGSFFDNRAAVVGTFVAIAVLSIAIFASCIIRRYWFRQRTHNRMRRFMILPSPQDASHDQPTMDMINNAMSLTTTYRSNTLFHSIGARGTLTRVTPGVAPFVEGNMINETGLEYDNPFGDFIAVEFTSKGLTGSAITTNARVDSPVPSLAPSTPSVYPPSLPPMAIEINDVVFPHPLVTSSANPPPRPPRRRPPPRRVDVLEAAAKHPDPSTSPSSIAQISAPDGALHKSSKEQHLMPSSSVSDHSRYSCSTSSATPILDPPNSMQLRRESTLFLQRALLSTRPVPRNL